jgi:hypothetical protein
VDSSAAPSALRSAVEDLRPGDHACHLYQTADEADATAARAVAGALHRGEAAWWIHRKGTPSAEALAAVGIDAVAQTACGALEVSCAEEFYLPDGCYDPVQSLDACHHRFRAALDRGMAGLTCVSDASVLAAGPWAQALLHAEAAAPTSPIAALCQLDRACTSPALALDMARAHALLVHQGRLVRNLDAAPREAILGREAPAAELDRLLDRSLRREAEEAMLRDGEEAPWTAPPGSAASSAGSPSWPSPPVEKSECPST